MSRGEPLLVRMPMAFHVLLVRPGNTKLTFTGSTAPLSAQVKMTYRTSVDGVLSKGLPLMIPASNRMLLKKYATQG